MSQKNLFLGIDIGSVSIKYALIDSKIKILDKGWFRTKGNIVKSIKKILKKVKSSKVTAIATTGSARKFVKAIINADLDIDEITAHRIAISHMYPQVKTIFEIGGQDSKLIFHDRLSFDFAMNNVCAAGTGSFLDQQASRLGMSIEKFFQKGLTTQNFHTIASKCTVFAESDMIHAQQSGISINEIIRGVHKGLVKNYFAQLCRGKNLYGKFLFEGGTSENSLLIDEFANKLLEKKLIKNKDELIIPTPYNKVIGAIGAAIIANRKGIKNEREIPKIKHFEYLESKKCYACANKCGAKVKTIKINNKIITLGRPCQI